MKKNALSRNVDFSLGMILSGKVRSREIFDDILQETICLHNRPHKNLPVWFIFAVKAL